MLFLASTEQPLSIQVIPVTLRVTRKRNIL